MNEDIIVIKNACIALAVEYHEQTYDEDGNMIGPNPDKVVAAAQKYFDFIMKETT